MNTSQFSTKSPGKIIKALPNTVGEYWAFVPSPLPPRLDYAPLGEISVALEQANMALGDLRGMARRLPLRPDLLIRPYMRKEAVLSSRIEGTQASLSELFYFEAQDDQKLATPDVLEVVNYVRAQEHGIKRLKENFPLSLRLIQEMHKRLLAEVRGKERTPGEFRHSQNWIAPEGTPLAEAVFVPPPVEEMHKALSDFEKFLHTKQEIPLLVQCALIHYQFETIHPFLDGNGRIGRLLIPLFLYSKGILEYPMLYISAFFERNRDEYYARLNNVRFNGDWDGWIFFFLRAMADQSTETINNIEAVLNLFDTYKKRIQKPRSSAIASALVEFLFQNPVITIPRVESALHTTYPTAKSAVELLVCEGILSESSIGSSRPKVFVAKELLKALERGGRVIR